MNADSLVRKASHRFEIKLLPRLGKRDHVLTFAQVPLQRERSNEIPLSELKSQRQRKRAQRRHNPEALRAQAPVQRTGDKGEQCGGCADADGTVDRLGRPLETLRHGAGYQMHASEMKQRESDAVQRLY